MSADVAAGAQPLARIVLDVLHRELGARMGGFAGYDMPIQYPAGLKAEHLHTRTQAGLFDVSHMGQLAVRGPELFVALERALPVDFSDWPAPDSNGIGQQRYSVLLNEQGGIEDDLMLVNLGNEVRIIVNAGNRAADLKRLQSLAPTLTFSWVDAALLALQGPAAEAVLSTLDARAAALRFMQSGTLQLAGTSCFVTRSGYTGEDGYEISVPSAGAETLARALLADSRVKPVGLGARDTLRLEAGLPLHGNDIGPDTTPVMAGLPFAIPKSRRHGGAKAGGFPGADRVLAQFVEGAPRKLVGLISDGNVPIRSHALIVDQAGLTVGEVTSGTVSPTLGKPVALAYVDSAALAAPGIELFAVVRDKRLPVKKTALPFVPKRYRR